VLSWSIRRQSIKVLDPYNGIPLLLDVLSVSLRLALGNNEIWLCNSFDANSFGVDLFLEGKHKTLLVVSSELEKHVER